MPFAHSDLAFNSFSVSLDGVMSQVQFHFHTLGCKVNRCDSEALRAQLLRLPFLSSNPAPLDVCVINTSLYFFKYLKIVITLYINISKYHAAAVTMPLLNFILFNIFFLCFITIT